MQQREIAPALIERAREAAIRYLTKQGYPKEAEFIQRGDGDDFPEVRVAAFALSSQETRIAALEAALRIYAQPNFWTANMTGLIPAEDDEGRIARAALAGEPFEQWAEDLL